MSSSNDDTIATEDRHRLTPWRRYGRPVFKSVSVTHLVGWDPSGAVLHLSSGHGSRAPRVESWNVRTGERLPPTILTRDARVAGLAIDAAYSRFILASADYRRTIVEAWDLRTGTFLAEYDIRRVGSSPFATSADGRLLVQCLSNHEGDFVSRVTAYALPGGDVVCERKGGSPVAVSPDGSLFVMRAERGEGRIDALEVLRPDGTLVATLPLPPRPWPTAVEFSGDGRRVIAGLSDGGVACWEVARGERLWDALPHGADDPRRRLGDPGQRILDVARSADGATFFALDERDRVCAVSADGEVVWRAVQPRDSSGSTYGHKLLPSPDGESLAVGLFGRSPRVVDAATGADRTPFEGHRGILKVLAVSPDGRLAASGDDEGGVRVYDLVGDETLWTLEVEGGGVRAMAFSRDGRSLWTAGRDGRVRRWSLATGFEASHRPVRPTRWMSVVAADDGARTLVVSDQRIDLLSDRTRRPVKWSREVAYAGRFEAAFSDAEGRVVVAAHDDKDANRWSLASFDAVTGRQVGEREEMRGRLLGLRPTDHGPLAVTVVDDRLVVRDAFGARREVAVREASDWVSQVEVSTDGRWMALDHSGDVEVWSLAPPARCVAKVRPAGEGDSIARLALSTDGALVVVATVGGVVAVYARTGGG